MNWDKYNSIIMEYKKTNLLDNTPSQRARFRKRNWLQINNESWVTYSVNSDIKLKTSMIRLILCDYSAGYIYA